MDFDETDLEATRILLQLPRLFSHSEIRFFWGSMKKRSIRRPAPLSRRETPLPFPNSKNIRITFKRSSKTSQNHHHRNSSPTCDDNNRRSCLCAVTDESSERPEKVKRSSAEFSRPFLLPDLNVPPSTEEEEEQNCTGIICESKDGISPRSVSARDEDGGNRCAVVLPKISLLESNSVQMKEKIRI